MHRFIAWCCVVVTACGDNADPTPPTADNQSLTTAEDTPLTFEVPITSWNPKERTLTVAEPPAHGTLDGSGPSWTYTPAADYSGDDSLVVRVEDSHGSATATVSIHVTAVNDAPVAVDDAASTPEDMVVVITSGQLTSNDKDVDADPITVTSVTGDASTHGTVTLANGSVTYTPATDYEGTATFTYAVSDGHGGEDTATVTVTVGDVDDAPVAVADTATVAEDSTANAIDVLANDTDVDGGPMSVATVTQPANGTVAITGGGTGLTYTPNANFCNTLPAAFVAVKNALATFGVVLAAPPVETFTYTLAPGGSTATVTVTVTCVDDPPVAVADTATVAEDSTASAIAVLANDTDIDGGPMAVASVTQPANGTVAITGGGSGLTYTPTASYCNQAPNTPADTFTYTLSPGGSSATVSLTVTCACGKTKTTDFVVGSN